MFPRVSMGDFGDRFRKAREKKDLSLDDVSNVTKIGVRMLRAIEEEKFDQLPGGVFNRGFIRAYAKHLGLNSEEAVSEYVASLRQAQLDSNAKWEAAQLGSSQTPVASAAGSPAAADSEAKLQARIQVQELPDLQLPRIQDIRPPKQKYLDRASSGIHWTFIFAAAVVLIAAFLVLRHTRNLKAAAPNYHLPAFASAPEPMPANLSTPTQTPTQPVQPPVAQVPTPAPDSAPSLATSEPALSSAKSPARNETTGEQNGRKKPEENIEPKSELADRSAGNPAPLPAKESASTLTLIVRASENSWISVTSDGEVITQETLIAPAATSFHAARELVVRVGNAAGVSFVCNGQEFPPQGAEAEVRSFVFDGKGMRPASSIQ